jgi:rRNA maturation endonuclease Nob1
MTEQEFLPTTKASEGLKSQLVEIQTKLKNLKNSPNTVGAFDQWLDDYLDWIEQTDHLLSGYFDEGSWSQRLYSPHYWHIRDLTPESHRAVRLVQMEADRQLAWLNKVIAQVETLIQEDKDADHNEIRAVLDTNVHLHFKPFDQITNWSEIVQKDNNAATIQLIVPLPVVKELDDKKNLAKAPLASRASSRLKELRHRLVGQGTGPVSLREGVRLSVFVPRNPVDMTNADEAILACVHRLAMRPGGPVVLVTGDMSMQLRAEVQNITVRIMPEDLRIQLDSAATDSR